MRAAGQRQVQQAQGEHGGEEQQPHDAEVDEQAHPRPAKQEGPQRLPPEGAVDEVQRDHERDEEGNVLRVEERVRVDARMQQEQDHGDERQQPVVEEPKREDVAGRSAGDEEQMDEQVPAKQEIPVVAQVEDALDQHERRLEGRAVEAAGIILHPVENPLAIPREVVERRLPDPALRRPIQAQVVIVKRERARDQEGSARDGGHPVGADRLTERSWEAQRNPPWEGKRAVWASLQHPCPHSPSGGVNSTAHNSPDASNWPVRTVAMG